MGYKERGAWIELLVAAGVEGGLPRGTVATFMTPNPETIPPDMDIYFAAGLIQVVLAVLALGAWPRPLFARDQD